MHDPIALAPPPRFPNAGLVLAALRTVHNLCQQVKDRPHACLQLHARLHHVFLRITSCAKHGTLRDDFQLSSFTTVLNHFRQVLEHHLARKTLVRRMLTSRRLLASLLRVHYELNELLTTWALASPTSALMVWQDQFLLNQQADEQNLHTTLLTLLASPTFLAKEYPTPRHQAQVLMDLVCEFASERQRSTQHSPQLLETFKMVHRRLSNFSDLHVRRVPRWFLPTCDVEFNTSKQLNVIGQGSFATTMHRGELFGAIDSITGATAVTTIGVKCLWALQDVHYGDIEGLFAQTVQQWCHFKHPHIVPVRGASHVAHPPFIVREYTTYGSLTSYIAALRSHTNGYSNEKIQSLTWQLLYGASRGLAFLHYQKQLPHGGLRCNNILVNKKGHAVIADYGIYTLIRVARESNLSDYLQDGDADAEDIIRWQAPECLREEEVFRESLMSLAESSPRPSTAHSTATSFASDVYAFGMCILEALTGDIPWKGLDITEIRSLKQNLGLLPSRPKRLSDAAWTLIQKMCAADPSQRLPLHEVSQELKVLGYGDRAKKRVIIESSDSNQPSENTTPRSRDGELVAVPLDSNVIQSLKRSLTAPASLRAATRNESSPSLIHSGQGKASAQSLRKSASMMSLDRKDQRSSIISQNMEKMSITEVSESETEDETAIDVSVDPPINEDTIQEAAASETQQSLTATADAKQNAGAGSTIEEATHHISVPAVSSKQMNVSATREETNEHMDTASTGSKAVQGSANIWNGTSTSSAQLPKDAPIENCTGNLWKATPAEKVHNTGTKDATAGSKIPTSVEIVRPAQPSPKLDQDRIDERQQTAGVSTREESSMAERPTRMLAESFIAKQLAAIRSNAVERAQEYCKEPEEELEIHESTTYEAAGKTIDKASIRSTPTEAISGELDHYASNEGKSENFSPTSCETVDDDSTEEDENEMRPTEYMTARDIEIPTYAIHVLALVDSLKDGKEPDRLEERLETLQNEFQREAAKFIIDGDGVIALLDIVWRGFSEESTRLALELLLVIASLSPDYVAVLVDNEVVKILLAVIEYRPSTDEIDLAAQFLLEVLVHSDAAKELLWQGEGISLMENNPVINRRFVQEVKAIVGKYKRSEGYKYLNDGEYHLAIEKFTEAIALDRKRAGYYADRSLAYIEASMFKKAADDAVRCMRYNPYDVTGYLRHGIALKGLGRYSEAIVTLRKGRQVDPKYEKIRDVIAEVEALRNGSTSVTASGEVRMSKAEAVNAMKKDGDDALRKRNYGVAIHNYTEALAIDRKNDWIFLHRSIAYAGCGEYDRAIEDAARCIQINYRQVEGYYRLALALTAVGKHDEALTTLYRGQEIDPRHSGITRFITQLEAEEAERAQLLLPEWFKEKGYRAFQLRSYEDAVKFYTKAITASPSDDDEVTLHCFFYRARANQARGEFAAVIEDCTHVLNHNPSNVFARLRRADAYEQLRDYYKALQDIRELVNVNPDYEDARARLQALENRCRLLPRTPLQNQS